MRLIDRVRARMPTVTDSGPGNYPAIVESWGDTRSSERTLQTFADYCQNGYKANGVVFSVILARLMLFSEATFKYQLLRDKQLFGDTSLLLLEQPWPGATTGELLARMLQDVDLQGNAYVRRVGSRLERLRPDWVEIVSVPRETLEAPLEVAGYLYRVDGDRQKKIFYPVDEVAHWSPIPDPEANFRGMSWLTPVVREVNADGMMTDYKKAYLNKSGTPNIVVKYQKKLQDPDVLALKERWDQRYGGPDGWKTAILDEGADLTVVGSDLKNMDYTKVQAAGENRIAAAGGVPGIVVGLKEGLDAATYSNYQLAMRRFADLTMRPLWRSAVAALAKLVRVPAGSRLWFDVTDIAALQEGEKERAEATQIQAASASALITAGYDPDTVTSAVVSGDLSLLKHTGAIPVQLHPDGKAPTGGTK